MRWDADPPPLRGLLRRLLAAGLVLLLAWMALRLLLFLLGVLPEWRLW